MFHGLVKVVQTQARHFHAGSRKGAAPPSPSARTWQASQWWGYAWGRMSAGFLGVLLLLVLLFSHLLVLVLVLALLVVVLLLLLLLESVLVVMVVVVVVVLE